MQSRKNIDKNWKFLTDPYNEGEVKKWFENGILTNKEVNIPHVWQRDEDLVSYSGAAWYERNIQLNTPEDGYEYSISFAAVDYSCKVWWNGKEIGRHEGGYTPFEILIPTKLIVDKNRLTVRVYDYEANSEIPIGKQGSWYTRVSGIWQSVEIEKRAMTYISDVFVEPNLDTSSLRLYVALRGLEDKESVINYEIKPHSFGEEKWTGIEQYSGVIQTETASDFPLLENKEVSIFSQSIQVPEIKLWDTHNPYLYEVKFRLINNGNVDEKSTTFGYRKVEQKEGRIYLNGKQVYIRGALDQGFYPDTIYHASSEEEIVQEVKQAKKLGFNLLRKHIKAELPSYLYWADRLGLLIWAEPPNYTKWTKSAQKRFINLFKTMLIRDFNHPSIILWSIYNEEWGLEWDLEYDKEKQDHVEELYYLAKKWDNTRLYCDNSGWLHTKTDINDYHRYFALPEQIKEWQIDLDEYIIEDPNKNYVGNYIGNKEPLMVSEFGMWGLPNVDTIREKHQGKAPWWFTNHGDATHQNDYKIPNTAKNNHKRYGIYESLGDWNELSIYSQRRMFRGVKSLIEEIRKRPQIGGYVLTEFTDVEWETNGILNFYREEKSELKHFVNSNSPVGIFIDISNRNLWSRETLNFKFHLTDDDNTLKDIRVKWKLSNPLGKEYKHLNGEWNLDITGQRYYEHSEEGNVVIPDVEQSEFAILEIELWSKDELVTWNKEELTFTNKQTLKIPEYPIFLNCSSKLLTKKTLEFKINIENNYSKGAIVVTDLLDEKIMRILNEGGQVLFLAEEGDTILEKDMYTFRKMIEGESWERASSMNYINSSYFGSIPLRNEVGWEADGLYPEYMIPFSDYKEDGRKRIINMFGNDRLAEESEVIAGYFQGWLGQNGGTLLKHSVGQGTLLITTWKLKDTFGEQPIGTQMFLKLIKKLGDEI